MCSPVSTGSALCLCTFFSLSLSPHCCIACAQRNDVSSYDHVTADKMQIIIPCYRYERRRNSLYNSTLSLSSLRLDFSCAFFPPFFLSSQQRRMCLVSGDMVRQKHFQTLSDYFCCACAVDFGRFIRCPAAAVDVVLLIWPKFKILLLTACLFLHKTAFDLGIDLYTCTFVEHLILRWALKASQRQLQHCSPHLGRSTVL